MKICFLINLQTLRVLFLKMLNLLMYSIRSRPSPKKSMRSSRKREKKLLKSMRREKISDLLLQEVLSCISALLKCHMSTGCTIPHCHNSLIYLIMVLISHQNQTLSKIECTISHNALHTKYIGTSIEVCLSVTRLHLNL